MTLQDAIKSGKRFKRNTPEHQWIEKGEDIKYSEEGVLATDWITEEPEIKTRWITVWRPIYFHLFGGYHSPSNWAMRESKVWDKDKTSGHTIVGWESKTIEVEDRYGVPGFHGEYGSGKL